MFLEVLNFSRAAKCKVQTVKTQTDRQTDRDEQQHLIIAAMRTPTNNRCENNRVSFFPFINKSADVVL